MVVSGVELDAKVRAAKAQWKGQRGGVHSRQALRTLVEWLALRDRYRTVVHARFELDVISQTSLAAAIAYVKFTYGPHRTRLWRQIHEAKRVRVEVGELCF